MSRANAELALKAATEAKDEMDLRFRQMLKPNRIEAKTAVDEYGGAEDRCRADVPKADLAFDAVVKALGLS